MRVGSDLLIPRPILPTVFVGMAAPVSFAHVVPPSVDFQIPLPAPPLDRPHVLISICQNPAYRMRGLVGSMTMSDAPVESLTNSTRCHVLPPSAERKMPRSGCGP